MKITLDMIDEAEDRLNGVASKTPLVYAKHLSEKYQAEIYIKREDLQEVRSFKVRGAYNKMATLTADEKKQGIVAASAGNHAQGVAFSCHSLKVKGTIFMPQITPTQKIDKVRSFGDSNVQIELVGNTFDEAYAASVAYAKKHNKVYIHPFNDPLVIAGQGTIGKEIDEQLQGKVDIVIAAIGGGGLIAGIGSYLKQKNPKVKLFGAEPHGAPSMYESLRKGKVVTLETIDTFVDGASVKRVGDVTFTLCKKYVDWIAVIPEGKICTTMVELYQKDGVVAEPAGALSIAALDDVTQKIKRKTVVCVLSGGNNHILRYPEVMERSLVYQGRKHYFIIEFAQKPGQLRLFVDKVLGPNDDIVRFEYMKKTNKEKGPALIGIELRDRNDYEPLLTRMGKAGFNFRILKADDLLYTYVI